jgi:heat-inducible transcriptional repressor
MAWSTYLAGVPLPELGRRQREILRAVVREYVNTAEPVGSGTLVRRYRMAVSPATVRNELAALEELGLLMHPHTSAGRVPTDLGYRYFIQSLIPSASLPAPERVTVSHQFQQAARDTSEWLRLAASTLARLTAEASIVVSPAARQTTLRHLEVVPISDRRALLVVVLEGGVVRQQLLELGAPVPAEELRSLSARLVQALRGSDAVGVVRQLASEEGLAAGVAAAEHDAARAREIYYDGIQNILAQPEFGSGARARLILGVLQDRTRLTELLPPSSLPDDVYVAIGSEHRLETLRECSFVLGRYGDERGLVGYLGVVGPTRMDYERSIGAVRYVGGLMTDLVRVVEGG